MTNSDGFVTVELCALVLLRPQNGMPAGTLLSHADALRLAGGNEAKLQARLGRVFGLREIFADVHENQLTPPAQVRAGRWFIRELTPEEIAARDAAKAERERRQVEQERLERLAELTAAEAQERAAQERLDAARLNRQRLADSLPA